MKVEQLQLTIVEHLPRWVSRWGFVRVAAKATWVHPSKQPNEIGLVDALEAWDIPNPGLAITFPEVMGDE